MKSVYYYLSVLIIFLSACHTNKSELETIKVAQFGDVFIYIPLYLANTKGFFKEEGLKVDPNNKTMIKNYGLHYLKAGLAAQKAGKAEEAEECFKKVIPLDHKSYKTNALYSLGVLCYNDGANILKKAAPLANSDADKYAAEKEKADARFKEAVGYLEEAMKVSPEDTKAKTMLTQVQSAMK